MSRTGPVSLGASLILGTVFQNEWLETPRVASILPKERYNLHGKSSRDIRTMAAFPHFTPYPPSVPAP